MCVIADDATARGIAGVMGGEDTGCTDATTNVFIEVRLFRSDRASPRTGRKLGIVSDARYRFERGVDPDFVLPGLELATKLILEFCGGEPSDVVSPAHAPDGAAQSPSIRRWCERLGGLDVPARRDHRAS